ncbi:hypothetical protein D3C71_2233030 [compost metagenome]
MQIIVEKCQNLLLIFAAKSNPGKNRRVCINSFYLAGILDRQLPVKPVLEFAHEYPSLFVMKLVVS